MCSPPTRRQKSAPSLPAPLPVRTPPSRRQTGAPCCSQRSHRSLAARKPQERKIAASHFLPYSPSRTNTSVAACPAKRDAAMRSRASFPGGRNPTNLPAAAHSQNVNTMPLTRALPDCGRLVALGVHFARGSAPRAGASAS
ncbi:hypothetical protein TRVL_03800 [Trypanosoma vivax]|nr:hypothetical protein TRVL_03800 [Trypanosoma vivax]